MKKSIVLAATIASLGFNACSPSSHQSASSQSTSSSSAAMEKGGLKVYAFNDSPKFPDAKLKLSEPGTASSVPAGEVTFNYQLENYQLTAQTDGSAHHDHANSAQGQHIHNIVDNEPYTAHYTTTFAKPMQEGSHVVLSFLSRSYHESLKHKNAYDLRIVNVGNSTSGPGAGFDVKGKHMFYSRPKGEYVGNDTKKIMLDFYLVNTDLARSGNKVRATINGTEFLIDKWQPHTIEGLPMGESTIKLELLDKNGNVVPGPFNTVERKITLKAS
ncbi:hypothetical protein [Adhaeribacter aquaticus]|uniref:hypothetical protein n=1 Tax=Adhaeribacter aquaticus TaxID=299567 RepID=UPI0004078FD7|nr:hypothetical protein [Adhaeribacter aquaticus]